MDPKEMKIDFGGEKEDRLENPLQLWPTQNRGCYQTHSSPESISDCFSIFEDAWAAPIAGKPSKIPGFKRGDNVKIILKIDMLGISRHRVGYITYPE